MTQALPKIVTFDEFITWYPENSGVRYELHNGQIVEMSVNFWVAIVLYLLVSLS
jgi:Uma2 family endonuclease